MKIDQPTPDLLPQLKELWKTAFGDSDAFIGSFFSTAFSPRRCRCATVDGRLAAALYWFDVSAWGQPMAYLYAVATAPEFRSQGICHALMADTHAHLRSLGCQGALLVPDGEALSRMYAKMGYVPCAAVTESTCAMGSDPVPLRPIGAEEYARLRRDLLPPGGVLQEAENLAFLESQAAFYAGDGFLLAAHREPERLWGAELLGGAAAAPGILRALDCPQGCFRGPGSGKPFAMFLPLTPHAKAPGYFGLAFD